MASTLDLLKRLNEQSVEFVVVGGLPGVIHFSSLVTEDRKGLSCRLLSVDALIRACRAVTRPKDLQAVAELEAIPQRLKSQSNRHEPTPTARANAAGPSQRQRR